VRGSGDQPPRHIAEYACIHGHDDGSDPGHNAAKVAAGGVTGQTDRQQARHGSGGEGGHAQGSGYGIAAGRSNGHCPIQQPAWDEAQRQPQSITTPAGGSSEQGLGEPTDPLSPALLCPKGETGRMGLRQVTHKPADGVAQEKERREGEQRHGNPAETWKTGYSTGQQGSHTTDPGISRCATEMVWQDCGAGLPVQLGHPAGGNTFQPGRDLSQHEGTAHAGAVRPAADQPCHEQAGEQTAVTAHIQAALLQTRIDQRQYGMLVHRLSSRTPKSLGDAEAMRRIQL
jgi:hypothetical protein